MNRLAKVAAPEDLASSEGAIARSRLEVPASWAGATIEVEVPSRLTCGACDGGGCDRCQRSGAVRLSAPRSVSVGLPVALGDGALLRVPDPFEGEELAILLLEVRVADAPSPGCRCLQPARLRLARPRAGSTIPAIALLLALLALLAVLRWRA